MAVEKPGPLQKFGLWGKQLAQAILFDLKTARTLAYSHAACSCREARTLAVQHKQLRDAKQQKMLSAVCIGVSIAEAKSSRIKW